MPPAGRHDTSQRTFNDPLGTVGSTTVRTPLPAFRLSFPNPTGLRDDRFRSGPTAGSP
ncbi:hypothetical protein FAGKG844_80014 [Frankia sp. AgKG'84/4]